MEIQSVADLLAKPLQISRVEDREFCRKIQIFFLQRQKEVRWSRIWRRHHKNKGYNSKVGAVATRILQLYLMHERSRAKVMGNK